MLTDKKHLMPKKLFKRLKISKLTEKLKRNRTENQNARKILDKVEKKITQWVREGKFRENYESMDEILDELNLTQEELTFFFSCRLHKKFFTWRKELRIEDAKELLEKHPEISIAQIGYIEGILDKSNFRHQFRSVVGCTPSEYRARLKVRRGGSE